MMNRPNVALLEDGRLHLQHGPIDLIIAVDSIDRCEIECAYEQASMRFTTLLPSLVSELTALREPLSKSYPLVSDPVARRMIKAVWPFRGQYITPMAAVAGAVADEILRALIAGRDLNRAYVNNGGDIALHLAPSEKFSVGIADIEEAELKGGFTICAADNVRGIATSGWRGRSFSRGIADSVTVLAENAALADAAATMIANAVNVEHPGIVRVPARDINSESDLGSLLVTRGVPRLNIEQIRCALDAGEVVAQNYLDLSLIQRSAIRLQGQVRIVSNLSLPRRRQSSVFSAHMEFNARP